MPNIETRGFAAAYADAKSDAERKFDAALDAALLAAAEVEDEMSSREIEAFVESHLATALGDSDRAQFVENEVARFSYFWKDPS